MRALIQRVTSARCTVAGRVTGEIGTGLAVLVGACHEDGPSDAGWLAEKIARLRVFPDASGHMNLDLLAVQGRALVVPQFTLYGDTRHGRRPDFMRAARPEHAEPLVDHFCSCLAAAGVSIERGVFRAHMEIALVNDGPVTLMIDSPSSVRDEAVGGPLGEAGA